MQYLKRNTKYSILAFFVIILSITISISTLAKTEVYFSLYDNPQNLCTTSPKLEETQTININTVSQDELIKILKISEPLAQKIINLRESQCGRLKDPKDLLRLPGITNLEWKEWEEEGININVI